MNGPYAITDNGFKDLKGPDAVDLSVAVESVMTETSRALDKIQSGLDQLAGAILRLSSIVALQVKS